MKKIIYLLFLIPLLLLFGCSTSDSSVEKLKNENSDKQTEKNEKTKNNTKETTSDAQTDYSQFSMEKLTYEDFTYNIFATKTLNEYLDKPGEKIVTASDVVPKQEVVGIRFDEMGNSFYFLTRSLYVNNFLFDIRVIDDHSEDNYLEEEEIRSWIDGENIYTLYRSYAETDGGAPSRLDISADNGESWDTIFMVNEENESNELIKNEIPDFEFHKLYQVELLKSPIEISTDEVNAKITSLEYLYDTTNASGYYSADIKIDSKTDKTVQFDIRNYSAPDSYVFSEEIDLYKGVPFDKQLTATDKDYLYLEDKLVIGIEGESVIVDLKDNGFDTGNSFFCYFWSCLKCLACKSQRL